LELELDWALVLWLQQWFFCLKEGVMGEKKKEEKAVSKRVGGKTCMLETKRGRHQVYEVLIKAIQMGLHPGPACKYAGIHRATYYAWLRLAKQERERIDNGLAPKDVSAKYLDFARAIEKAEAQGELSSVARIRTIAADEDVEPRVRLQADTWFLERAYPERWGKRQAIDVTGETTFKIVFPGMDADNNSDQLEHDDDEVIDV
jgi:hypothetical protein